MSNKYKIKKICKNKYAQMVTAAVALVGAAVLTAFVCRALDQPRALNTPVSGKAAPTIDQVKKNITRPADQITQQELIPAPLPVSRKTEEPKEIARFKEVVEPEPELLHEDEQAVYLKAEVFRDEALATFPVHTVEIHVPQYLQPEIKDSHGRSIPSRCPPENEIWVRVKPGNVAEMKEIMAQTADLYRVYVQEYDKKIRVVNWVNGQPWAAATYKADGSVVDVK